MDGICRHSKNGTWLVFQGSADIQGEPLEIVLPKDKLRTDTTMHVATALNTLCAVSDINPEELVLKIKFHDRDVLKLRNPETGDLDSIPLKVASQQVSELKQLVAYSACSEESQKPFYFNSQSLSARRMVEQYRFGHTFRGSFGFTIESPAISRLKFTLQQSLMPNLVADQEVVPVERKVMERIVQGLLFTQEATTSRDSQKIIANYKQGFNSNMCRAIVNMSMGRKIPLEYSVSWSSRSLPSNEEIKDPGPIQLNEQSYEHLEFAAEILSELEPEQVTVKGLITDLSADDNPLGLDTSRSIVIRWIEEPEGRTYKVFVVLSKEDYIKAINAHREWIPVSISGTLRRIKTHWRLTDYFDFRVG